MSTLLNSQLFRLKIAAKRQITVPQRLLDVLNIAEGDEIQIATENGQIVSLQPCKSVPTAMLSEEVLSRVQAREKLLTEGKGQDVNQFLKKLSVNA